MRQGRDLQALAAEIVRQAETKKDFVASTKVIEPFVSEDDQLMVRLGEKGEFPLTETAHRQVATQTDIPVKYYDRMRKEAPGLLATNIGEWFAKYPAVRLNRTLDGSLRAFLSDKYQPFDNFDFAQAALPILSERKLEVMSCEITERRLYIKAVDTALFRDVPVGHKMGDGTHTIFDTNAPAIILSNSEVGFGRLVIETGVYTRACTNLALFAKGGLKRTHVGARHHLTDGFAVDEIEDVLSHAAKRKTLEALWLQARDVIAAAFNGETFAKRCEQMTAAAQNRLPAENVQKVLEVVREKHSLTEGEQNDIFKHLLEGGRLSQYGLSSAITRAAQDAADYDRATELEYLGGKVIELPRNEWERLAA